MEERGDVHTALAEMERKLGDLQRELTGEGPEQRIAPQDLHAVALLPPIAAPPPPIAAPPPPVAAAPPPAQAHLRAGPFADIESLRRFEQALQALDGVEEVVLRGFEADRALFDVRLAAGR